MIGGRNLSTKESGCCSLRTFFTNLRPSHPVVGLLPRPLRVSENAKKNDEVLFRDIRCLQVFFVPKVG